MRVLQLVKSAGNVILVAPSCAWCLERAWREAQAAGGRAEGPNEPGLRLQLAEAHAVGAAIVLYAETHGGRLSVMMSDLQPLYLGTLVQRVQWGAAALILD
jgi:hypothetical protein